MSAGNMSNLEIGKTKVRRGAKPVLSWEIGHSGAGCSSRSHLFTFIPRDEGEEENLWSGWSLEDRI